MKKTLMTVCSAALILLGSCSSNQQFYGAVTGASLGGMFGSSIGGITDGPRGHDKGALIGMLIGGAIGVAATAPKNNESSSSDRYNSYGYEDYRDGVYDSPYADIAIENIRFNDRNNNRSIDAGEHSTLSFEIRNYGRDYVYDIAPVISVSGTKHILLSPTAIVSELAPGRAVRYKAEVVATDRLRNGVVRFDISFSNGSELFTLKSFEMRTYGR